MADLAFKLLKATLDSKNVEYDVLSEEDGVIRTGFPLNGTSIKMLISVSKDRYVSITGFDFVNIPEDKLGVCYVVANACNAKYSHIKFYVDEEHNTMRTENDAIIQPDSLEDEVFEIIVRMLKVVEDAYPLIMKAIWS